MHYHYAQFVQQFQYPLRKTNDSIANMTQYLRITSKSVFLYAENIVRRKLRVL
jgi:hypothetical protein